jgi:ribonucleotide monophosphatase NagD (HAD superfamily)
MDFGFASMPSILVICYFVGMIVKISPLDSRYIPIICGIVGAVLGVVALFLIPDVIGSDPLMAVAIGITSGLAATGVNQIGTQLHKESCREVCREA